MPTQVIRPHSLEQSYALSNEQKRHQPVAALKDFCILRLN